MSVFQPPPPLLHSLPDLVSLDSASQQQSQRMPPVVNQANFPKQQVVHIEEIGTMTALNTNTNEAEHDLHQMQTTMLPPTDDSIVCQKMMDCSMDESSECSSGIQVAVSSHVSGLSSATHGTTVSTPTCPTAPQSAISLQPSSPRQIHHHHHHYHHHESTHPQDQQAAQLFDIVPSEVVKEIERIMKDEKDKVVLTNSVCLLFRFSIDSIRGHEYCQSMSASPEIMNHLYDVLTDHGLRDDDLILCYATGNLTNISKYDEGRAAILGLNETHPLNHEELFKPSRGVLSLISSLQSRDSNVVIFAITAIHNLLLDRRQSLQEIAKEQIMTGIRPIVQLLDNQCLIHNYEFKVIVLDCLQILAYGNSRNRLAIKKSGGPLLLLQNIVRNFDNHQEELVEVASRVLKSLSACTENKKDIIKYDGIDILSQCIGRNNPEILKTCLWTLRNLSDVINSDRRHEASLNQLVVRLLDILEKYAEEYSIITCALGILANLTCNNDPIKQFICENNGVDLLLNTISFVGSDRLNLRIGDKEVLEPALCALCHLLNQNERYIVEDARQRVMRYYDMFKAIERSSRLRNDDLSKTVEKLIQILTYTN